MIRIDQLVKGYQVDDPILSIDSAEIAAPNNVALIGENGAGKSTLLLMIAGLLEPTSGTILIDGHLAGSSEARAIVSFVPDKPSLFDDLTIVEQMRYVARLNKHDEPFEFAMHLAEVLGAESLLDRFARTLSKGQRQKAGLLVATARPFSVLLLDEPTAGLDRESHGQLVESLDRISDRGGLVVSSTHDPELIASASLEIRISDTELVIGTAPLEES